ncbi:TPA: hypothetical protein I7203_02990 [Vibrio vulnificus]|nr:hypothetical protein [Vibrio vulnificus]HAS6273894.1 hypothetical protein [Vibrio vulnificus]HDY7536870.1 hypothetical protein [Vibrio vulnificus]HDY8235328.1 hypothetical protein [Vibrio vulnificus]
MKKLFKLASVTLLMSSSAIASTEYSSTIETLKAINAKGNQGQFSVNASDFNNLSNVAQSENLFVKVVGADSSGDLQVEIIRPESILDPRVIVSEEEDDPEQLELFITVDTIKFK